MLIPFWSRQQYSCWRGSLPEAFRRQGSPAYLFKSLAQRLETNKLEKYGN